MEKCRSPQVSCLMSQAVGSSVLDHPAGQAFANGPARPLLDARSTLTNSFSFIWEAVVNSLVMQLDFGPASAI